jgi:hypothetical protein
MEPTTPRLTISSAMKTPADPRCIARHPAGPTIGVKRAQAIHDSRPEGTSMNRRDAHEPAAVLALTLMLAACASAPAPTATAPVKAAQPVAAIAGQAAESRPDFPGFKRVVRDGVDYFCQTRAVTGSRARAVEVCRTRDEMLTMEKNSAELMRDAASGGSHSTIALDSPN